MNNNARSAPTIVETFERTAERVPDRPALLFYGGVWTHAQLRAEAERWAAGLASLGIERGDRVVVYATAPVEVVLLFFACARLGAALVPVTPDAVGRELEELVRRVDPRVVFTSHDTADRVTGVARITGLLRSIPAASPEAPADWGVASVEDVLATVTRPSSHDLAVIWFTSGTTGTPKGAPWDHECFLQNAVEKWGSRIDFANDEVVLKAGTMAHNAMAVSCLGPILRGHTVELLRGTSPAEIAGKLAAGETTFLAMAPTVAHLVLDALAALGATRLERLRGVVLGGGPVGMPLVERLAAVAPNARIFNGFGASEGLLSLHDILANPDRPDALGVPYDGIEVEVRDDDGRPVADGEVGMLWARGAGMIRGYWDAEDGGTPLTWVSTGDLVRRQAEGLLALEGRAAELIVSGGFNVMAPEVEAVVAQHPSVREVAVVGCPDDVLGERVVAFVSTVDGSPPDVEALKAHCAELLSRYKRPRDFVGIGALPKTPLGKVRRHLLTNAAAQARPG